MEFSDNQKQQDQDVATQVKSENNSSTKKAELSKEDEMYDIKNKLKKDNIFIYECWNCSSPMMLHQKHCSSCQALNDYFDDTI